MEKIVAGAILAIDGENVRFLVKEEAEGYRFVTTKVDQEKTSMGSLLIALKAIGIPTAHLELLDLVDITHTSYQHLPLYVFELQEAIVSVQAPYTWVGTACFRRLLGKLTLQDIANFT